MSHMHGPSEISIKNESKKFYMTNDINDNNLDKNVLLSGNLKTPYTKFLKYRFYMNKKRLFTKNQNISNKDTFDWEENIIRELNSPPKTAKNTEKVKFM